MARIRVLDSIASNLTVLCQSCSALDATSDPISIQSHRSAYLAYVCLLAHIVDVSEAESRASAAAPAAKGKVTARQFSGRRPVVLIRQLRRESQPNRVAAIWCRRAQPL